MSGDLDGHVALVTGAARGQGRSHAVELARRGASILAYDLCGEATPVGYDVATPDDLAETERLVVEVGGRIETCVGDVRDYEALAAFVQRGIAALGPLDTVVANAGVCNWNRFWEMSPDQWNAVIDINLTGVWHTLKAAAIPMIEADRGGSMIVVSSVAGVKALPAQAHYSASKHGLVGLTKTAAIELAPYGIRVNSIHPWAVDTPMGRDKSLAPTLEEHPGYRDSLGSLLRWAARPADISAAVVWLASAASRTMTGTQMMLDQGATTV